VCPSSPIPSKTKSKRGQVSPAKKVSQPGFVCPRILVRIALANHAVNILAGIGTLEISASYAMA